MISMRFSILVYAIFFMLLHSLSYSLQGDTEKMVVMAKDKIVEGKVFSRQEKEPVNVVPSSVEVVLKRKVTGGRKMMKKLNQEHINGEEMASKIASSSSSSANPTKGYHKAHKKSKKIDHDEHKVSTFMVINADYHVPRSHPPKNN